MVKKKYLGELTVNDYIPVSRRLRLVREHFGKTQFEMAAMLGITQPALSIIEKGSRDKVDLNIFQRLAYHFPEVSMEFLFLGTGNFLKKNYENNHPNPVITLPYFSYTTASATFGKHFDAPSIPAETISVYKAGDVSYDSTFVLEIDGESMEPTLPNRSKLLLRSVDRANWQYINGGVYLIDFANQLVVKRVRDNALLSKGELELHSDNPNYGSLKVKAEDLRHIAHVLRIVDARVY